MRLVVLTGMLLALVAASIGAVVVLDRPEAGMEARVRRYAHAITSADPQAALAELSPDQRAAWSPFISSQLGNIYEVRGIAVRSPALLDRLRGSRPGPTEVTVVLDVNRGYAGESYTPTTRVPIERVNGVDYLARPLLSGD